MKKQFLPACAECELAPRERICLRPGGKGGKSCPTLTKRKLSERSLAEYRKADIGDFAREASVQEGSCYIGREQRPYVMKPMKPRIQEIGEFSERMGYHRLGLIFCTGLYKEAAIVSRILQARGFDVISVTCKVGSVPKEEIGVADEEKVFIGKFESMCNPILQAKIANEADTEFNILLGLCVGHDSLVFKYSKAPTTVLAVKDRVTGHNPLAAVYMNGNYYSWLEKP
jgi:uncharacterized metal-binding protein